MLQAARHQSLNADLLEEQRQLRQHCTALRQQVEELGAEEATVRRRVAQAQQQLNQVRVPAWVLYQRAAWARLRAAATNRKQLRWTERGPLAGDCAFAFICSCKFYQLVRIDGYWLLMAE